MAPTVFARYYEFILALKAGQKNEAEALYRDLADEAKLTPSFRVLPFGDVAIASEGARYRRWLTPKSRSTPLVDDPNPETWPEFEHNVAAGLDLIDRADAALGAELRSLVVEVIGASRHRDSPQSFGGASSFMLWGTVFLNVDTHRTRVDVADGLVHEGAHQLLFGASCRSPLVRNALHEHIDSPLRLDARPVIGVFHATFVCARLAYAFAAMLRPDLDITEEERKSIERRLQHAKGAFAEGNATLRRDADLTDLGRQILDEAEAATETV